MIFASYSNQVYSYSPEVSLFREFIIMKSIAINNISTGKSTRLHFFDALRGFDMFRIGGEGIFHGLASVVMTEHALIRNQANLQIVVTDNLSWWKRPFVCVSNHLQPSPWNGFTFYDRIFPAVCFYCPGIYALLI